MIKVVVTYKDNLVNEIDFLGHASYDSMGKDIVCASLSSAVLVTFNGINSIDLSYLDGKKEEDRVTIFVRNHDRIVNVLIDNLVGFIKSLAKDYPDNIKLIDKEE